jgi:hypothetical protein
MRCREDGAQASSARAPTNLIATGGPIKYIVGFLRMGRGVDQKLAIIAKLL